jgi:acetylornithine/succinyldiaminopimelate/putrescine aminotransferase
MAKKAEIETAIETLHMIRKNTGEPQTKGLSEDSLRELLPRHDALVEAVQMAREAYDALDEDEKALLKKSEKEVCDAVQEGYVNFYPAGGINPYVPLAARGPWIVTCHGAVLHDTGGYGMIGLGHNPPRIREAMGAPHVMANVMTPSLAQRRFSALLKKELGHTRGSCPFDRFICLNSGSESVTITTRIADIHAKNLTQEGARHAGKEVRTLALVGGFHGRTDRPARMSQCTRNAYETSLASFERDQGVDFVPVNDVSAVEKAFEKAENNDVFYQGFYIEPVMGEGISGLAITREFYDAARSCSTKHDALLVVDSIQAALRAQGCLSIVDYPGFSDCEAPDMETYSKALNAGQYPLSVVALSKKAADTYVTGVYGNTMTTNPKALDVGCAVLESLDEPTRKNIRDRGTELVEKLEALGEEFPGVITSVNGTGLLVNAELNPEKHKVTGADGFEKYLRRNGIEMIHGGTNGLRFTPHFTITSQEIDLIISTIRKGFEERG